MRPQGERLPWLAVPAHVRHTVAARLGSPVVRADNQPGGFSPGVAARCQLADGRRCFVKAVSPEQNPDAPAHHRREARVAAALPGSLPVPRLLEVIDDGTWVVVVFEDVEGAPPPQPWSLADLDATFTALAALADAATPCPVPGLPSFSERHGWLFTGYRSLAGGDPAVDRADPWTRRHLSRLAELEAGWEAAAGDGNSLLHSDLRADNLLVRADGSVVVVDWPHACVGSAWIDPLLMLPSVGLDGGPAPETVQATLGLFRGIDPEAVDRVLVALSGFFTLNGLQPDPPGLPTLRPSQRAQASVARRWLADRLGLEPTS